MMKTCLRDQFLAAVENGDVERVQQFVALKIDLNVTHRRGSMTALHIVVRSNRVQVLAVLLRSPRVDINYETLGFVTPLMAALYARNYVMIEMLLKAGARKVNSRGKYFTEGISKRDIQAFPTHVQHMMSPLWTVVWSPGVLHQRYDSESQAVCREVVAMNSALARRGKDHNRYNTQIKAWYVFLKRTIAWIPTWIWSFGEKKDFVGEKEQNDIVSSDRRKTRTGWKFLPRPVLQIVLEFYMALE